MSLVLRRAGEAKGLLLAAGMTALVAVTMVTGLVVYNGQALESGRRAVLAAASPEERSVLITGSVPAGEHASRHAAVREAFADGLGGLPVVVSVAQFGTGRQIIGDLGEYARRDGKPVFAAMATLEDLSAHADLVAGAWPEPGGRTMQVALPEDVAGRLGVELGDVIPLLDRATEQQSEVAVAGLWRPRDLSDPYWRLTPEVAAGDAAATTIGPFVLHPDDFARTYRGSTSAAWLITPDLSTAYAAQIRQADRDAETVVAALKDALGQDAIARPNTRLSDLADRLGRADLVGRSALLTPVLLVAVLSGYALVLIAALLSEDRREQTALLRARGAARRQIAGLAVREAALVVLPVALLALPVTSQALRYASGAPALAEVDLDPRLTPVAWLAAGVAALGCALALTVPALRRSGTYVEELAARSRPSRRTVAQRAGVDVALVGLAGLAWVQLRQYASPLVGEAGVDPLLASAPILGILAGGVVALRLLPPATRIIERFVTKTSWTATVFGVWQAGRRPHAGPVLLLALAVGTSTFAWSLVATWQRSLADQADHQVGADLRVIETETVIPAERRDQINGIPGARSALPAWRVPVRVGALDVGGRDVLATLVAWDASAAADVLPTSTGVLGGGALLRRLADARIAAPGTDLPVGARRLTGAVSAAASDPHAAVSVTLSALLCTADGQIYQVPLTSTDGAPVRFTIDLPEAHGQPLRLAGFHATNVSMFADSYRLEVTDLRAVSADGSETPLEIGTESWTAYGSIGDAVSIGANGVRVNYSPLATSYVGGGRISFGFTLVRTYRSAPVAAVVTPDVLDELGLRVGQEIPLFLSGPLTAKIVGVTEAVPGVTGTAVLVDLPSIATALLHETGRMRSVTEWWIATDPARHAAAVEAARDLPGVVVLDRLDLAAQAASDPYWVVTRVGFLAATIGAVLLAVVGLVVDVWATARRRLGELSILNTLGASPSLLVRALLAEQAFLAGIGVTIGLIIGGGVGATLAPLVILTPSAERPVPAPVFELPWGPVGATAAGLLAVALALSGAVALTIRRRLAAALLRIGADR